MPMIEFWEEFRIANENTEPRDTFFANIKIDDQLVDFAYRMQIEGNPVRVNIGKNVTVTEKKTGEKIGATVTDILDDLIILKRKKETGHDYGSGKMPLRKIKFEPNERNISNILNGVDSLDTDHLKVLFPVNELPE